jgi:hypothetical protein
MKKVFGLSIDFILALFFLALLVVVAVPRRVGGGSGPSNSIYNNLRVIEGAKEQWALEQKKSPGDTPGITDLAPYLRNGLLPPAIVKEKYEINPLGISATARLIRKMGPYEAGTIFKVNGKGEDQLAE